MIAAHQAGVCGIDDGIGSLAGDIALDEGEPGPVDEFFGFWHWIIIAQPRLLFKAEL